MHTHARKFKFKQNKLLEANHDRHGKGMYTRAAQTTKRNNQAVETVATVDLTESPEGKAVVPGRRLGCRLLDTSQPAVKARNLAMLEQKKPPTVLPVVG